MKRPIEQQAIDKAIKMYRKGELKVVEISNLVDISVSSLNKIFKKCFDDGTLTPRQGSNEARRKFTEEQEHQIAIEYYKENVSGSKLKVKWNIHPMQLQRIRNKYKYIYGVKQNVPNYIKARYNKSN